jgi:fermentation-respiration switch protein FrsA (DUF1100 family)
MFLLCLLIAYVLLLVLIRAIEPKMIFFPDYPGRLEGDWHPRALAPEDVWLTTSDDVKLHAWWIAAPGAAQTAGSNAKGKFTFLAFHGNASNIANRAAAYEFLRGMPANVLAVEYRGYGHSEGKPSEAGLYLDADAAWQYLVETRHLDRRSIISFGQSLGTAVATHLAAQHEVGGLVLEAPFPSAASVARKTFWFLPGLSLLVYGQFDTRSRLQQVTAPVFIVHCAEDPVVPFEFGQDVHAAARAPKQFLQINGQCHEESSLIAPEKYRSALLAFLSSLERR